MKKKSILFVLASAVVITGCASVGANERQQKQGMMQHGKMNRMMMDMGKMDANKDGQFSKDEFMKFHEGMFDMMKNKDGMVDMKAMHEHCSGMMSMMDNMKGDGHMMQHRQMGKPTR